MRIKITLIKRLIVPIACISFALSSLSPVWADPDLPSSGDNAQAEIPLKEVKTTLQKKSSKMVTTYGGDRYGVDKSTLIVNKDGQQILLQYLLVPCEAQLLYETTADGGNYVHRIKVLKVRQGASNNMDDPPR